MRELHWNFNNNLQQQQDSPHHRQQHHHRQYQQTVDMQDRIFDEPWLSSDFSQLTRKQQNCEIYRVRSGI